MNIPALVLAVIIGLIIGSGISMYAFANTLDKSNNMGDSLCEYRRYCKSDITYERYADDVKKDSGFGDPGNDPLMPRFRSFY